MNNQTEIARILENFSAVAVLIVGDLMLDRYWWGSVERISPEAPVPIVKVSGETLAAGGAANVAANVAGLGARVYLVAAVGEDAEALGLPEILRRTNISAEHLIQIKGRPTTLKTRVVAHSQHVVRIDQETGDNLALDDQEKVWRIIERLIDQVDVIILSDYAKGFLSDDLAARLIMTAKSRHKIIMADPKGKDYGKYSEATIITPNRKEAAEAAGLEERSAGVIDKAGRLLAEKLRLDAVLITQGEDGMTLFEKSQPPQHFGAQARHVYDVTGAGDTVIATLAVAAGAGADLPTAAKIANTAAGFVVEEVGTTVIRKEQLVDYFGRREV